MSPGSSSNCNSRDTFTSNVDSVVELRPVHTKDDNYKDNDNDIVLKIVLNIKE